MRLYSKIIRHIYSTALIALCWASSSSTTRAAEQEWKPIILNVPIAGIKEVSNFGTYFQLWYSFAIGAVGVLATVMIMWGGFKWLTSRGNSGVISESKQIIWSAIIGVVLAFLSYTILYLINPQLTTIGLPTLSTAQITVINNETIKQLPNVQETPELQLVPADDLFWQYINPPQAGDNDTGGIPIDTNQRIQTQNFDILLDDGSVFEESVTFIADQERGGFFVEWDDMNITEYNQFTRVLNEHISPAWGIYFDTDWNESGALRSLHITPRTIE